MCSFCQGHLELPRLSCRVIEGRPRSSGVETRLWCSHWAAGVGFSRVRSFLLCGTRLLPSLVTVGCEAPGDEGRRLQRDVGQQSYVSELVHHFFGPETVKLKRGPSGAACETAW